MGKSISTPAVSWKGLTIAVRDMLNSLHRTSWLRILLYSIATTGSLISISVLLGWYTQSADLVQIISGASPMQFNTALCFLFSGLGLFYTLKNKPKIALTYAALIFAIAIATAFQHLTGISLKIDEIFVKDFILYDKAAPGRMSLGSAIGFTLVSANIFTLNKFSKKLLFRNISSIFTGLCLLCLSSIALLEYVVGIEQKISIGALEGLAFHTSLEFWILGASFLLIAIFSDLIYQDRLNSYEININTLIFSFTLLFLLSVYTIWQNSLSERSEKAIAQSQQFQAQINNLLSSIQKAEVQQLNYIVKRDEEDLVFYEGAKQTSLLLLETLGDLDTNTTLNFDYLNQLSTILTNKYKGIEERNRNLNFRPSADNFLNEVMIHHGTMLEIRSLTQNLQVKEATYTTALSQKTHQLRLIGYSFSLGTLALLLFSVLSTISQVRRTISRQKQKANTHLQEKNDFLEMMMQTIPDYLFVKDKNLNIVAANSKFLSLFPKEIQTALLGTDGHEFFNDRQVQKFRHYDVRAFEEGYISYDEELTLPNGETVLLQTQKKRFIHQGQEHIIAISRDMTNIHRAEIEKEQLITELSRSNKELDEFAYIASHDLKAPLRVIDNASQWLAEDLEKYLDEDSRENLNLLRGRVSRMERLLDDLLEYSRINRVNHESYDEEINGFDLLQDTLKLIDLPQHFNVQITDEFKQITLNRMPLQQVFLNLISNAIKHHEGDNGEITIGVLDAGKFYKFFVQDNGPGIPEQYHQQIFKMFQTLKPRDRVEGSGIGLAIVHKHIQAYGGTITVESKEGNGARFEFLFPKNQINKTTGD